MRKLMIAAPKSGSGKTILTCGLLEVFKKKFVPVASFKCGPDYIDPLFHKKILGQESRNLDSFFEDPDGLREVFLQGTEGKEEGLALIEGVMGYFDGLGGTSPQASAWDVAGILDCPVILVVDAKGASLSLIPLIKGFLDYQPAGYDRRGPGIAGIILNRVSPMIYTGLKETLERELGVPVAGYIPPLDFLKIESRHLGLILPDEIADIQFQIRRLAGILEETLDIGLLLEISQRHTSQFENGRILRNKAIHKPGTAFHLGIAKDEAFCFYYRENLQAMEKAGGILTEFSPLHDKELPDGLDGLLLGGGYPELYADKLAENETMRMSIRKAAESGMPILGECGGFLYLLENLKTEDGHIFPMAGVFSGESGKGQRLGNFGYLTLTAEEDLPFLKKGMSMRGHEFHYWQTNDQGAGACARKPAGNKEWLCMRNYKNTLAGFPHLYYRSCPEFIAEFARCCRDYRMGRI